MTVNSYGFLLFFAITLAVYFLPFTRRNAMRQNAWLLIASYAFYAIADWRMVPLLLAATVVFFLLGQWLATLMRQERWKLASRVTTLGVTLGVGILLYFKYLNFFGESIAAMLHGIGLNVSWTTLHIVIPVGVSFFTFKLISYIVEIHRERIAPASNFVEFATYVAFFPTILSGPIDRPNTFLPQLRSAHSFNRSLAVDGCRQILWGMFTKMCIADNLASLNHQAWSGSAPASLLLAATLLYPIQLYADFAGYSDMAIGVGKLLGFNITRNFNHPLLARNVAEYWRRWHMSLTTWITQYVFMPLNIAFRSLGRGGTMLAIVINLVVIGLWHGAGWNYALFGLYNGLMFLPLIYAGSFGKNKKLRPASNGLPHAGDLAKMLLTYCIVAIGLTVFCAPSAQGAAHYFASMASASLLTVPHLGLPKVTYLFITALVVLEWTCRGKEHPLQFNASSKLFSHRAARWTVYYLLLLTILLFQGNAQQFIYFQF